MRQLGVLAFAHGASDFYSGMVPLIVFTIVSGQRLSPVYQGLLGFLWYLTSSIVQPLFGAYSDERGRWWFLPAGVALTVAGVSAAGLTTSLPVLAMLIVLGGIGSAVMHPEAGKYTAMLSGARRSTGISIFQIGGALGYALGPIAIARLVQAHGTAGSIDTLWFGGVAVAALFAAMYPLHDLAARRHREHRATQTEHASVDRVGVGLLVVGTALKYLVGAAFMTYLPNLIVARGGSIADAGLIVTLYLGVGVAGMYLGGYLGDRFGIFAIAIASLAVSAPVLTAFFALHGAAAIAMLLIANILLNIQSAPSVAIVQRMLPRNLGMALGLMNGVAFGVGSAMVTAVGLLVARAGAQQALFDVAFLPLACALVYGLVALRERGATRASLQTARG